MLGVFDIMPGDTSAHSWNSVRCSVPRLPRFAEGGGLNEVLVEKAIYIILVLALLLVTMYLHLYLKRWVKYWKMSRDRYMDDNFKEVAEWSVRCLWSLFVMFAILWCIGMMWPWFLENVWTGLIGSETNYLVSITAIVVIVIIVGLVTTFIHRFFEYVSGNLKDKPEKPLPPQVALVLEIILKYMLIIIGAVISLLVALAALGMRQEIVGGMVDFLTKNENELLFIIVVMIIAFIVVRIMSTFLDDMKRREVAYSKQLIDILKILVKYVIYLIVGIAVGFTVMGMFELGQTAQIIIIVLMVIIILTVSIAATSSIRNGFSGMVLMGFRPFEVGDRVRLADGLSCEVLDIGIMFTKVRNIRGEVLNIPNNSILENPIVNYSKTKEFVLELVVHVPHAVSKEEVEEAMTDAAIGTKGVIREPSPQIFILHREESHDIYELHVHTSNHATLRRVRSNLIHSVKDKFHAMGIKVLVKSVGQEDTRRGWSTKVSGPFNLEPRHQDEEAEHPADRPKQ